MKIFFKVISFICTLIILSACKKGEELPSSGDVIISKQVIVIKNQTWEDQFISIDSTNYTITFSKNITSTQKFNVGDIIVSAEGEGLLRKVKSISTLNNEIVVQTESATFTDVIKQGLIEFNKPLTISEIKSIDYHYDGIKLKTDNLKGPEQTQFNWDINTVLYDNDGSSATTYDQIKLIGTFSCDWQFALRIDVGIIEGLKEVKFGYESSENLDLQLITGMQYSLEKEVTLATVYFTPIVVEVGVVPVVFTPQLDIIVGIEGSANASVTSKITQSLSFDAGIQYLKATGWAPYKTFDKNFGFQPPQLNMNASAGAYFKPELLVKVYSIVGPYANLKLFGRLDANVLETPWWKLYAGIKMDAGAKVDILDKFLLEFTVSDLIDYQFLLAQATSPPVLLPSLTTTSVLLYSATSATVGGNVTADGGASVTERGVYWSISQNPELTGTKLPIGSGTGSFSTSLTGLDPNTPYYVKAYAINSSGKGLGNQVSFTTASSNGQTGTVTDIEGNVYKTITIGAQTWMVENLKTTKYNDGTAIPNITVNATWAATTTGSNCDYSNTPANSTIYGRLYNWYAVDNNAATKVASNGGKNVCPTSWHVPTDTEWTTLTTYLGGESVAGGKLKETGISHWQTPNTGATNETGFTALPGGCRDSAGAFGGIGGGGGWWSSMAYSASNAYYRLMYSSNSYVGRYSDNKHYGFSVRCIKDN